MAGPEPPRVAAIVDTSGSMSVLELQDCLAELLGLVRAVSSDGPAITVLTVDQEIQDVVQVRRPGDVPRLRLRGGGGTDMRVGLEHVAELPKPPEVVVVLTDGLTPWPPEPPAGLSGACVIAVISTRESVEWVPDWIRPITTA